MNMKELLKKELTLLPHRVIDGDGIKLPGTYKFWGADTEELYNHNLQIQPSDWDYRTKEVEYKLNSKGYRCPEFNTIDWENAIVIHGCSQVFGIGLAAEDTISSQLQQITDRPVINLGKNGASMDFALANNILLENNFPKPFAVINHWTCPWRETYYATKGVVHISGPVIVKRYYRSQIRMLEGLGLGFNDLSNDFTFKAHMISHLCKKLWKDTNYIETTWFSDNTEDLGCYEQKFLDMARDTQKREKKEQLLDNIVAPKSLMELGVHGHSGIKSARALAEYYGSIIEC